MARVKPYKEYFSKNEAPGSQKEGNPYSVAAGIPPLVFQVPKKKLEALKTTSESQRIATLISSVLNRTEGQVYDDVAPSVTESSCTEAATLTSIGFKTPPYHVSESEGSIDSYIPAKRPKISANSFQESSIRQSKAFEVPEQSLITACSFPPNEYAVTILKRLSDGQTLPDADLDYALTYISFLKGKNRQSGNVEIEESEETESLNPEPVEMTKFQESLRSQTLAEEQMEISDDEPPLLTSSVRLPVPEPERPESPEQYAFPDNMPHLRAVLRTEGKLPKKHDGYKTPGRQMVTCEMCGTRMTRLHSKWWHSNVCSGVILRSLDENSSDRYRHCPRCDKILTCNKDFEIHMAVVHKYYWYIEFENEAEYQAWFKKEGLDETMYILSNSVYKRKSAPGVRHWTFSCANNRGRRVMKRFRCPSHMYVRNDLGRFTVKYWPAHSHSQKITRMGLSHDCRRMVEKLIIEGLDDKEIMTRVRENFSKTSMNQLITKDNVFQVRRRVATNRRKKETGGNVSQIPRLKNNRRKKETSEKVSQIRRRLKIKRKKKEAVEKNEVKPVSACDDSQ